MEHNKNSNDSNKSDAFSKTDQLKLETKQVSIEDPKGKESDASNKSESKRGNMNENKTQSKTENMAEDKRESVEGKNKKESTKEKNKKENTVENEKENNTENESEDKNENKNKKIDNTKSTAETFQKEEEQSKNEKNNTEKGSSPKTATVPTGGNDIGKFLEFVQSNKDNPELMQQLLNIVNVSPSASAKREETASDKKEGFEINGISVKREEQYMKSGESVNGAAMKREDFNIDMFQRQPNSYSNEMTGFGKKQQSSFCKMFEKNAAFSNINEQNQNRNNAELSESPYKKDTLNQKLLSTLISDFAEKKNFEDVKGMLDSVKMRENEERGDQVTGEGNTAEVIKKKHDKLVEDNDEYDIDTSAVNDNEREATSILTKFNMKMNNDNVGIREHTNNINAVRSMCASSNYKGEENANDEGDFKLYHSKYTWVDLHVDKELINVLVLSRFYNPSKIQAFALPIILNSNKNLIAQSQNGSGKTLTFVIGMLSKINRNIYNLQAMCICPTRELSQQNYEVIKNFANYLKLNVFLAVPLCERYNKNAGWQLYVGTPGKTLDFLKRKYVDTRNVKLFVLDEADDLIDVKNNMATQVDYIKKFLPKNCQVLLFSATYNKQVLNFADRFAPQAIKIRVRQEDLTLKCVKQYYLLTENDEHKYYYLSELYCSMTISQCVIFVNSKQSAFKLYKFMTDNHHNVTLICADSVISRFTKNKVQKTDVVGMDPQTRDTLMADFKKGISKVLICTDLLSRGIDIPSISLVINFDLPYIYHGRIDDHANSPSHLKVNMETYIHRIGRTGRFGSKGMAINFINKQQLSHIKQIEHYYQCTISDLEFDSELMKTSITKLSL